MPHLRALFYARVSSPAQKRKTNASVDEPSLTQQFDQMRRQAVEHDWPVVVEVEDVIPGKVPMRDRPGGAVVYEKIAAGEVDLVMVYDNDRIGRDEDALVAKIFRADMRFQRIQIFSVYQPIEPKAREEYEPYEDDSALWLESVSDTASSVAIRQLRRRHTFGIRERVETKKLPVGRPPIGYLVEKHILPNGRTVCGNWYLDSVFAPIVRRVFDLYEAGFSHFKIAGILNREGLRSISGGSWTRATLRNMIQNPVYFGAAVLYKRRSLGPPDTRKPGRRRPVVQPMSKWLIVEGAPHHAIISREQWERCQEIARVRSRAGRTYGESSILSGLVRCGRCGHSMWRHGGWKGGYFSCSRWTQTGHAECEPHHIHKLVLERRVLEFLASVTNSEATWSKLTIRRTEEDSGRQEDEARTLESQLQSVEGRLGKAKEAYEADIDTLAEYSARKRELLDQRERLGSQLVAIREASGQRKLQQLVLPCLREVLRGFPDSFRQRPLPIQKMLLREIIEKVVVDGKEVEVKLKIRECAPSDYERILKVTHHGSLYGSSVEFLQAVQPKVAIISVGKHNLYHHPGQATLERLKEIGASIYRTDLQGAITVTSDGQNYWTKTEK